MNGKAGRRRNPSLAGGHANVLLMPDLKAGNMLVKELTFVARAEAAGLAPGDEAPEILASRADNDRARLAWRPLPQLNERGRREGAFDDKAAG